MDDHQNTSKRRAGSPAGQDISESNKKHCEGSRHTTYKVNHSSRNSRTEQSDIDEDLKSLSRKDYNVVSPKELVSQRILEGSRPERYIMPERSNLLKSEVSSATTQVHASISVQDTEQPKAPSSKSSRAPLRRTLFLPKVVTQKPQVITLSKSILSKAPDQSFATFRDIDQQKKSSKDSSDPRSEPIRAVVTDEVASQLNGDIEAAGLETQPQCMVPPQTSIQYEQRDSNLGDLQLRITQLELERATLIENKARLSSTNHKLLEELNQTRKQLESTQNNLAVCSSARNNLSASLKQLDNEDHEKRQDDLVAMGLIKSQQLVQIQQLLQERTRLLHQAWRMQQELNEAKMIAYMDGKDLMKSEIGTLKRKVFELEQYKERSVATKKALMDTTVAIVRFAKVEVQYLFGGALEGPYLDVGGDTFDLQKAFGAIQKARLALEEKMAVK